MTHPDSPADEALEKLRLATLGTAYEGRLYLVGGALRDRALGIAHGADLDLALEGDAIALAKHLHRQGLSSHYPVLYPRFGTAMIHVMTEGSGVDVELVTARTESYAPESRKPYVAAGTLEQDILRRDFTINTLAQNIHTGEMLDVTGKGLADLEAGTIRTPVEPQITFYDDPLRMLRAVRFAARFRFVIEPATLNAIQVEAYRLQPPAIACERIRDEFVKIAMLPGERFRAGMEMLLATGLLEQFLPEMLPMIGCTLGKWHRYDVWGHTLLALEALPPGSPLELRLALLWHDVGKPHTRHEEAETVRFYGHAARGAELTRAMMARLKFSNDEIHVVTELVRLHMRLGEYRSEWDDPAVRRLIRDTRGTLDMLFVLTECDRSAVDIPAGTAANLEELHRRTEALMSAVCIESPLNGSQIMQILQVGPGPHLKQAKDYLLNAVIDGRLLQTDATGAREMLVAWWKERSIPGA